MKCTWNGVLSFGMVAVPVKAYGALHDHTTHFKLLHKPCGRPINQPRMCKTCNVHGIPADDIVRGAKVGKEGREDLFVPLTDAELDALPLPGAHGITIDGFVPPGDLNTLLFRDPLYLGPDEGSEASFALFVHTLSTTKRVAVGKARMRSDSDSLISVWPHDRVLVLWRMAYTDELNPLVDIPYIPAAPVFAENDVKLATMLVRSMPLPHPISEYRDVTEAAIRELVAKKAAGVPLTASARVVASTESLSDQLRRSMAAIKAKGTRAKAEAKP